MSPQDEVRACILEYIASAGLGLPDAMSLGSDDFDLRLHGGVDSVGFVRLIDAIEQRTGAVIDLAELEPEKLTRLGALTGHIAHQLETHRASRVKR